MLVLPDHNDLAILEKAKVMDTEKLDDRIKAQEDRIKKEAERLEKLKNRREQIEAQKLNQLLKGQRAADTRRKILAGAMLLHWMETDDSDRVGLMARLDAFLTRPDDRKLFGFQEKGAAPEPEPQTQEDLRVPSVPPAADAAPVEPSVDTSESGGQGSQQVALQRIDLITRYEDRDAVKAAGGVWDAERKVWFVKPGLELARFAQWLPSP